jgi:hypothetical protein
VLLRVILFGRTRPPYQGAAGALHVRKLREIGRIRGRTGPGCTG